MRDPFEFKRPKAKYIEENRNIGARLRAARKRAGFTQIRAAKELGETQSYVSKIEKAQRRADLAEGRAFIVLYNADANEILIPERAAVALAAGAALAAEAPQPKRKRGKGRGQVRLKFRVPAPRTKRQARDGAAPDAKPPRRSRIRKRED